MMDKNSKKHISYRHFLLRYAKVKYLTLAVFFTSFALFVFTHDVWAQTTDKAELNVIFQTEKGSTSSNLKKDYYSRKILDSEISFLKNKLEEQEAENNIALEKQKTKYEQLLTEQKIAFQKTLEESSYPVITNLEKKLRQAEKNLEDQKKIFDQALMQKEREHGMEIKALSDRYEKLAAIAKEKEEATTTGKESKETKALTTKIESLKEQLKIQNNVHREVLELKEKDYDDKLKQLLNQSKQASGVAREQDFNESSQALLERDSQIRVLTQRLNDLNEKIDKERKIYERALLEKEREYKQKEEEIREKYEAGSSKEIMAFGEKLNEKYKQLDQVIREKEKIHAEELLEKEQELQKIKEQFAEKEKALRQLAADKELALGQKVGQEKEKYEKENQDLKKSSEQLRMYLIKLKEELKTKIVIISEKDNQIAVLNKKLALYSHEEGDQGKKISKVIKQDLQNTKDENKRLRQESAKLKDQILEQKSIFEKRLAQQKKAQDDLRKDTEAEIIHNSFEWEKKMRIMEAKYIKNIRELEQENLTLQHDFELKMEKVSEKIREKITEDEKIKDKLTSVRKNQVAMLEEMLASKAAMLQKVSPDFKKEQKDRAEVYFNRAMNAILKKDYARAKYELEEVLLIEPENQMTINILGSINFLLEKKQ